MFRAAAYRFVGEVNGYRDGEVLAALRELVRRGEQAAQQRDEWIARTVAAEDALQRLCGQLAELLEEHAPTSTAG
ncbi:MAG: hypothetical protein ACRDTG_28460 [Pseudonocardiaceae bacterium]